MDLKSKIVLGILHHRGDECISLQFQKDFDLIREVRKISGIKFSKTHTCWYVVNGNNVLDSILETLRDKVPVDDSALRDKKPNENDFQRKVLGVNRECPIEYIQQLDRMRYSENTKKTYVNFFGQFLDFFQGTLVDDISDDQV